MSENREPDKYDREIERLRALPDDQFQREVNMRWSNGQTLFEFLTPDGLASRRPGDDKECGCPTMVKSEWKFRPVAWTDELTEAVRALPLPKKIDDATKENLTYFAEAQRLADRMIRGGETMIPNESTPPTTHPPTET